MDPSHLAYIFAGRIPLLLLLLGGIVFAMARWNRHPRVSFLTVLGLGFYLLESTLFTFLIYLMPSVLPTGGPLAINEIFFTVLYVLDDFAYAAVIIVLVSAVFTQRASAVSFDSAY
jgi:hypothetical protein